MEKKEILNIITNLKDILKDNTIRESELRKMILDDLMIIENKIKNT